MSESNPLGETVYDFFGHQNRGKQLQKVRAETGASELEDLTVELLPSPPKPASNFQGQVANLLRNTPIASFHRIDSALAKSWQTRAREAHLEQFLGRGDSF